MNNYALDQQKTPLFDALREYRRRRILAFDVPGHKQGKGNPELTAFLGKNCLSVDTNSMKMLDNLIHPVSVIKEAEELAADAFGAKACFFMVNGTSSAVQAMVMSVLNPGDKIIMPRNVHRSAINALILARAIPVYVNPGEDTDLGIPLGMSLADIRQAIAQHPEAKAILVNNPTYYGVCADLQAIVTLAHSAGMRVLVDEAHGTHFYFGDNLPISAMAAGADMAAVSTHKTGGSLTQSSLLLVGEQMEDELGYVRQIINLTQTTSASYLLLSSLDITRKNLALRGREAFAKICALADYARSEINRENKFYAFGKERINGEAFYDFDTTKLSIHTRRAGLAGIEVYDLLRDDYDIQTEFGDLGNLLAIISVGDNEDAVERLLAALTDIVRLHDGS
ncbi:MAG: aminotransferase class I/II-fold pyridoxal phosphate-dependent enzyme, partial [Vagococcus sp.]|nr:aminotransferase class I/II-fold pyridoxal phosphate-dependent enzyme [Vagococcus sp.]